MVQADLGPGSIGVIRVMGWSPIGYKIDLCGRIIRYDNQLGKELMGGWESLGRGS